MADTNDFSRANSDRVSRRDFLAAMAGGVVGLTASGRFVFGAQAAAQADFAIGLVADCQYRNGPPRGTRFYRLSPQKLEKCVQDFNAMDLEFVIHLGDFIDGRIESFDVVGPIYQKLTAPKHHVLGNHDFAVGPTQKDLVPKKLNMPSRYYDFLVKGWRFVVLDGNDVSLIARNKGTALYKQAQAVLAELKKRRAPNAQTWNGGLSDAQKSWLQSTLSKADAAGERVIVFCHFPVYPPKAHNLWDDEWVVQLLASHKCVAAYMNGHNHAGAYGVKNGVHYVTLPGMVETRDTTAYGRLDVRRASLDLKGTGRTPTRRHSVRPA